MSDNSGFVTRLTEACGTSKPAAIAELLEMRYQTIHNYLKGRLPSARVLIAISEKSGYSIDWLLTGRGSCSIAASLRQDTPLPARQLEAIARKVVVEVINEINVSQGSAQEEIVRSQSSDAVSEKVR